MIFGNLLNFGNFVMARKKLILICQSGGEFVTNDDGSLSYNQGEANAVDVHGETLFEDLKSKLAEMLNFNQETLSIKYFLPRNRQTLITLANAKDLKRMIDFHGDSVTADVFISGEEGFISQAKQVSRKKSFQTFNPSAGSEPASNSTPVASPDDSSSDYSSSSDPSYAAAETTFNSSVTMDASCTPADTVKNRRRTASRTVGVDLGEHDIFSRKKRMRKERNDEIANDMETVPNDDEIKTLSNLATDDDGSIEYLVESWKSGIKCIDQDFRSVGEFREVLQKYAMTNRFAYRFKKNDTTRASAICVDDDCPWAIYASWVSSHEVFRIKKLNNSHTCGGKSWKSAHPAKKWLVNIIKERLRDTPHHKTKEIANSISQDFGIELSYSQVWRGVDDARQQLRGSYTDSYNQLPWLCGKILELNPGSVANLVTNDEKRFKRLFISFHASIHGFKIGCLPLIFIDSMSLKSKYQEKLMIAMGVDGNDGFFPIGFAIVDTESGQNWQWFFEELKSAISTTGSITFILDKEKGLQRSVMEVFENAHYGYSMYHLLDSFKKNLKGPFSADGRNALPASFLSASHAFRSDGFKKFTDQIRQVSPAAYDWVMQVEPEYWASAFFKGEPYTHFVINAVEPYTKLLNGVRELPIIQKIDALRCFMMELIENNRMVLSKWNTKLTPSKEFKLHEETIKAMGLKVLFSSDTLFEVHGDSTNVVNIDKQECTCLSWKVTGLPCCHAIAVFNCKGTNVYDYCSQYFTTDNFFLTYSESINPLPVNDKPVNKEEDASPEIPNVLPPFISRIPGRQKSELTEKEKVLKRVVLCTKCREPGHNKTTCKVNS